MLQNLRGAVGGWPAQVRSFYEVARDFEPDVVVSDFESFVLTVARRERVPAISVDNIMMLDRCRHDEGIIGGDTLDFELARQIARTKAAGLHHAIVPTFFRPPLRRKATTLVAPVLREAVLAAVAEQGEHLLVYQTAAGSETLVRTLHETGLPCRLYGVRRDLEEDLVDGELVYRPFSETGFLEDLRTARGVIAGGGFSLLSRVRVPAQAGALDAGRRPVRADAERAVPASGSATARTRRRRRRRRSAPSSSACRDHERALAGYAQDGNNEALAALREQLALVALERAGRSAGGHGGRPTGRTRRRPPRDARRRRAAARRPRRRSWPPSRSRSRARTAGPRSCPRRTG